MALLPRIAALAVAVTLFLELTPRRWYDLVDARPLPMASSCWGRRCVLIIAGGALPTLSGGGLLSSHPRSVSGLASW